MGTRLANAWNDIDYAEMLKAVEAAVAAGLPEEELAKFRTALAEEDAREASRKEHEEAQAELALHAEAEQAALKEAEKHEQGSTAHEEAKAMAERHSSKRRSSLQNLEAAAAKTAELVEPEE